MLLTLLGDYLGVMSFAPLSCPLQELQGCVTLPAWGRSRPGTAPLKQCRNVPGEKFQHEAKVNPKSGVLGSALNKGSAGRRWGSAHRCGCQ